MTFPEELFCFLNQIPICTHQLAHIVVCKEDRTVDNLPSILFEVAFLREQIPIEPCQTAWLCNNVIKHAKTAGHSLSTPQHFCTHYVKCHLINCVIYLELQSFFISSTSRLLNVYLFLLDSSHTNYFVHLSKGEIFILRAFMCMCCLPTCALLFSDVNCKQRK